MKYEADLTFFGDKDEDSAAFVGLLSNNLRCRMVRKVGPTPFLGESRGSSYLQGYD